MTIRAILVLILCTYAAAPHVLAADASTQSAVSVYEAYREWKSKLPPADQGSDRIMDRYREHLVQQGASAAEADRQLEVIAKQGRQPETDRWNRILTSDKPRFNTQPNAFLVERIKGVRPGKALDVGMGQGRNALFLAQEGWEVAGFDLADQAVAAAKGEAERLGLKIDATVADAADYAWGANQWDLIVLSYVPVRENAAQVIRSLRPGGLVVIEGAHVDATQGRSIDRSVVFESNELIELFPGFRVLRYEDEMGVADFGGQVEARLVRLCAQKVE